MDIRSVVYGAAVPTVAFIVGLSANLIPKDQIIIVLASAFIISAVILAFDLILVKSLTREKSFLLDVNRSLNDSAVNLEEIVKVAWQENLIVSTEMQIKIEKSAKQVWVITEDFHWDISSPQISALVKKNIDAGVEYRYFFPNSTDGRKFSDRMDLSFNSHENFHLHPLNPEIFLLLQHEIVVYDADDASKRTCLMADVNFKRSTMENESKHLFINRPGALPEIISNAKRWIGGV